MIKNLMYFQIKMFILTEISVSVSKLRLSKKEIIRLFIFNVSLEFTALFEFYKKFQILKEGSVTYPFYFYLNTTLYFFTKLYEKQRQ